MVLGWCLLLHDDVINRKHFPCYWPFVCGIHRPPANSPHKGQWCGSLMFYLICAWTNWFETPSCPLWRHCNNSVVLVLISWSVDRAKLVVLDVWLIWMDGWMDGWVVYIFHVVWILCMHVRAREMIHIFAAFIECLGTTNRYVPANWRSRSPTVCFTCIPAQN